MFRDTDYEHGEAFCIMRYRCEDCHREEVLWNSRDGVTPFCIDCRVCKGTQQHIIWQTDQRDPKFDERLRRGMFPGMRVFVDASPYHKHIIEAAKAYVDKYWDAEEMSMREAMAPMDKRASVEHFIQEWTKPGSPTILLSSEYLREHVAP